MTGITKGIILAGGSGTRLFPLTISLSKQLLPVYDKPMIFYPLSTLMLAGIRQILIITTLEDQVHFKALLGDGTHLGLEISYAIQEAPNGLGEAFLIGEDFIGDDPVGLILGDNIYYGQGLTEILARAVQRVEGATIFGYFVRDPERYGVVSFDGWGRAVDLVEKPKQPMSNYAVPGLYFYDNEVIEIAKAVSPSYRGELEITDINNAYLRRDKLTVEVFGRGIAWLDAGTHESLLDASQFIHVVEQRQGLKIACPEEIAFRKGYIDVGQVRELAEPLKKGAYGKYLLDMLEREV